MEHYNDTVSCFKNFNSISNEIALSRWLQANRTGERFRDMIVRFRNTNDKSIKKSLPLITVGGLFRGNRKMDDLLYRTGWLAFDIDYKDNPHLPTAEIIRDEIAKIEYVAFSSLSVSGRGVWGLVKVSDSERQATHFLQLIEDFKFFDIIIDKTKGRNPNDARFLSYDPDAIIKKEFKIYDRFPPVEKDNKSRSVTIRSVTNQQIQYAIEQITSRKLDIAPDYDTYLNIGFALADHFGENGRDYYHAIVCYSDKYNRGEAEKQYSNCLRSSGQGITIGTLLHYLNSSGIDVNSIRSNDNNFYLPPNFNIRSEFELNNLPYIN